MLNENNSNGTISFNPMDREEVEAVMREVVSTSWACGFSSGKAAAKDDRMIVKILLCTAGLVGGILIGYAIGTSKKKK